MSAEPGSQRTFHTRLKNLAPEAEAALADCAGLLSQVERSLFASLQSGKKNVAALKREFLPRFKITARHFNACSVRVKGLIDANLELLKDRVKNLKTQIKTAKKVVAKLEKKIEPDREKLKDLRLAIHGKKRKLADKQRKLENAEADLEIKRVRVAFGTKKLFRAQASLEENGYIGRDGWIADWRQARTSQFFALGSKDESSGNQTCRLTETADGTFTAHLRLPDALVTRGHPKILVLTGIRFPYGSEHVTAAVAANRLRAETKAKEAKKDLGQALSFTFSLDRKGWRLLVATAIPAPQTVTRRGLGRVGVDLNQDHLAVCESDRFGNPIRSASIPLVTYGRSGDQVKAATGDAAKTLVAWARDSRKPLVLERLDFKAKKAALGEASARRARQLSSFAYSAMKQAIVSRAFREGVEIFFVNPAYTSLIGRVKFQEKYGLTSHQSAALAIARRQTRFSERPPKLSWIEFRDSTGIHGTFPSPARKTWKHVWSWWNGLNRGLRAAVAPRHRAQVFLGSSLRTSRQLEAAGESVRCDAKASVSQAETPGARRQNCSGADGLETVGLKTREQVAEVPRRNGKPCV